jgi:hypothetical protein
MSLVPLRDIAKSDFFTLVLNSCFTADFSSFVIDYIFKSPDTSVLLPIAKTFFASSNFDKNQIFADSLRLSRKLLKAVPDSSNDFESYKRPDLLWRHCKSPTKDDRRSNALRTLARYNESYCKVNHARNGWFCGNYVVWLSNFWAGVGVKVDSLVAAGDFGSWAFLASLMKCSTDWEVEIVKALGSSPRLPKIPPSAHRRYVLLLVDLSAKPAHSAAVRDLLFGELRASLGVVKSGAVVAALFDAILNYRQLASQSDLLVDIDRLFGEFPNPGIFGHSALRLVVQIGVSKWPKESHAKWVANIATHVKLELLALLNGSATATEKQAKAKCAQIQDVVHFMNEILHMTALRLPVIELDENQLQELFRLGQRQFGEEVRAFLERVWCGEE